MESHGQSARHKCYPRDPRGQLTGFDISTAALKLAALSLYLTAIEIDPTPVPPEKLKFKQLRDKVLFNFRRQDEPLDKMVIGSLGSHVNSQFDGQFDLVLSNPPWTSLPKEEKTLAAQLTAVSQQIIANKGGTDIAQNYRNPDSAPDLPFLWRSTEWCKPHGRIAMALPSRILLKQEPIPSQARNTVLQTIEVTGIINGSNLSDTKVWPGMSQPFMLLFARNRPPKVNHLIRFITPYCETALNRHGEVRIDFKSAQPIEADATAEQPWLWKALTVGTSLDVDVILRLHLAGGKPLGQYWEEDLGLTSGRVICSNETKSKKMPPSFIPSQTLEAYLAVNFWSIPATYCLLPTRLPAVPELWSFIRLPSFS